MRTILLQTLSIFLLTITFTGVAALHITNQKRISIPLIHKIPTSYHSYNISTSEIGDAAMSPLHPDQINIHFLANISMGNPPTPLNLAMDTGSAITWVCTNCYNPKLSTTYNPLPCFASSSFCSEFYHHSYCSMPDDNRCSFAALYGDLTNVGGFLAMETLTFMTSDYGSTSQLENFLFGIGDYSGSGISGILALGYENNNSLISRVPNKRFSYCLGNINDPNYEYSMLMLGGDAILKGSSTPMFITIDGFYSVKLDKFLMGDNVLPIEQAELSYNFVIDSGTTYTFLRRRVFDMFKEELGNVMTSLNMTTASLTGRGERLCYWGDLEKDLKGFPTVTLRFFNNVELKLSAEAIFQRADSFRFCMAVDVSGDMNIVGAYAQQYYNIGFDLVGEQISFEEIDCEYIDD